MPPSRRQPRERRGFPRIPFARYAFAWAYLACFVVADLVFVLLTPHGQAALTAWASTNVANMEHEPVGPLVLSALIAPGYFGLWPVLIALAVFGANRALGNTRTALVCVAGHVIGSLVSEGIVAYRVDAGQLPVADRHLTDVGPSYVVVSAIVIALIGGTSLARALALLDFAILVFGGQIFSGLSHLEVAAVGHLTAIFTAAAAIGLIRRKRISRPVTDEDADQVGDPGGAGAEYQLPQRTPPERPAGQPGYHAAAGHGRDRAKPERGREHVESGQVRQQRDERPDGERG
jgi:hypothetical protein